MSRIFRTTLRLDPDKPASAQAAAEAIDSLKWPELLGTIAGDNTILVIARSEEAVESVVNRFHALIKR